MKAINFLMIIITIDNVSNIDNEILLSKCDESRIYRKLSCFEIRKSDYVKLCI